MTGLALDRVSGALGWVKRHFPLIVIGSAIVLGGFGLLLMFDELSRLTGDLQRCARARPHRMDREPRMSVPEHTDAALDALDPDLAARLRFVLEADSLKIDAAAQLDHRRLAPREQRRALVAPRARWRSCSRRTAREPVDVARVVEMLLVHDLVEIDAGDTFVYDDAARAQKEELEQRAADRLFAMIPGDDGVRLRARWDEFEARETPEARFAHSVDRLAPLLLNHANRGELWAEHGITADRVSRYNAHIADGSPDLWTAAAHPHRRRRRNEWIAE